MHWCGGSGRSNHWQRTAAREAAAAKRAAKRCKEGRAGEEDHNRVTTQLTVTTKEALRINGLRTSERARVSDLATRT